MRLLKIHYDRMKRLILVDDDPAILDVFGLIFKGPDYSVSVYREPDALLNLRAGIPDLIFIDKQLSGADGLDVCRRLKRSSLTKQVPVILISASPDIQRLAKEVGAIAGVEKPFSVKYLRDLVKETLTEQA